MEVVCSGRKRLKRDGWRGVGKARLVSGARLLVVAVTTMLTILMAIHRKS